MWHILRPHRHSNHYCADRQSAHFLYCRQMRHPAYRCYSQVHSVHLAKSAHRRHGFHFVVPDNRLNKQAFHIVCQNEPMSVSCFVVPHNSKRLNHLRHSKYDCAAIDSMLDQHQMLHRHNAAIVCHARLPKYA